MIPHEYAVEIARLTRQLAEQKTELKECLQTPGTTEADGICHVIETIVGDTTHRLVEVWD